MPEDHWFIYEKPQSPFVVPQPEPGFQLGDPHDYPKPPKSEPPPPPPAPPARPPVKPPAPAASALPEPPGLKRNPEPGTRNPEPRPLWQLISGLGTADEAGFSRTERRAALRKLLKFAEAEMRAEMLAAEEEAEKEEHTFLWDPVPAVCVKLGISRTRLTLYSKEFSGMSASQMADRIRAEKIKARMRENLSGFVREKFGEAGKRPNGLPRDKEALRKLFWQKLKDSRRSPDFSLATWAIEHGFANYTRFYRACLLGHGQTPSQLEWAMLLEIAEYFSVAEHLAARHEAIHAGDGSNLAEWREQPYKDGWAVALKERPEWLAKMRGEFGLCAQLCSLANG